MIAAILAAHVPVAQSSVHIAALSHIFGTTAAATLAIMTLINKNAEMRVI